ncbi:MAG TPA: DUF4168 domain-containing protein [Sinorhizobium sp.]|nr:DUF4168 domain-containing protein [Sinorhizobium sp.]
MITRYTAVASLTAAVFSLMALSPASALEVAQAQTQSTEGQTDAQGTNVTISEQKLEAFAVAYLEVDKIRQEYAKKIEASSDAAATDKLKTEASQQMVEAVKTSDISVEEYTAILTAAQNDPAVAQKVQEKLQKSPPTQQ